MQVQSHGMKSVGKGVLVLALGTAVAALIIANGQLHIAPRQVDPGVRLVSYYVPLILLLLSNMALALMAERFRLRSRP